VNPPTDPARPRRRPLAALLLAVLLLGMSGAQGLGYDEALRLADASPTVRLAERALEIARRQLAVASAPVRGELGGGYRWTQGERDLGAGVVVDLDDDGFDPFTLALTFPTVGVGQGADAVARARADVERAVAELAAVRRTARVDVTQAFQRTLRAREALELARADLSLAELEAAAGELRRLAGAATDAELARLALGIERARAAADAAARELSAAERFLALLVGGPADAPVGPLPDPRAWSAARAGEGERRPDVLGSRLQVAETDRAAASALREQLPSGTLTLAAGFASAERNLQLGAGVDTRNWQPTVNLSYDPDSGLPGPTGEARSRSLTVALAVRVPLNPAVFDAIAIADLGRERAAAQLDLTRARAELDADQRRAEFDSALANADLAAAAADLARAEHELAELRFAAGALSELALRRSALDALRGALDADRALDNARVAALRWLDALADGPAPLE